MNFVSDSLTLLSIAHQAPRSMGFSRQEYCNGLPFPSPGDLSDPRVEPGSPVCRQTLYHLNYQERSELLGIIIFSSVLSCFRKGRGTRDQIANIHWIMEKAREFQKNIYFCFIDYAKAFDCVDQNKLWKIL